jgi:signal transduction histidine kinase
MPQPHRDLHDQYIRQYLHTGIKKIIGVGREVDGMRKDGTIFPISLAVTEVKLESQRLFLGMVRDLTEQVKQEAIKDSLLAREAHQLGRVEMASGILHDLGNVMTGITTQATAIKTSLESSTVIRRLTQICEFFHAHSSQLSQIFDANKSSALLNYLDGIADLHKREHHTLHSGLQKMLACCSHSHDLIMAHRSYAGTSGNMSIREISLRKLFFDVQMMMSDAVTKRNGVIITRCSENLPHIKLDQSKLIQVLLNLIKNSIEAYEQRVDRQQLEITLSAQQITSGECVIQVSDNGLGIAPHQNNDIFIDGYSTKKRGSGLGLGMSRRVIETLGGSLTLKSDGPNTGTTAHIQLPKEIFVDVSSAER